MAYDFLGLVNDVNKRLNEVELTDANFADTTGYYSFVKEAVNSSIRHVNQEEYEWPWNHREEEVTLTAGISKYPYPLDAKTLNMNTFRIKRSATHGNATVKLKILPYEEYLDKYVDNEYNSAASIQNVPEFIVRTPSRELILVPTPDKAYELVYEYFQLGYDLELHNDVPTLPEQYRNVIVDGAMYYVYQFRSDTQMASLSQQRYEDGIKYLRSQHINRTNYIRDRRVHF
jgi:hypothetical protein